MPGFISAVPTTVTSRTGMPNAAQGSTHGTLRESDWRCLEAHHADHVDRLLHPHLARRSRNTKHAVYDFLFEYYSFRPGLLRRWHPGIGVHLEGDRARKFLSRKGYRQAPKGVTVDPRPPTPERRSAVEWIQRLLKSCAARSPQLACYGLHEWAMVYRNADRRHPSVPLRFESSAIATVLETAKVCCSHFDAFRFFTPTARPLNRFQPSADDRLEFEQTGCLHVNMDLYKWACKLLPWTPSSLLIDCFELAIEIREIDMRASPYDLTALGFEPIKIETPSGRSDYERHQRHFAESAIPLRRQLIEVCNAVLRSS
jgi:hypothetical protein